MSAVIALFSFIISIPIWDITMRGSGDPKVWGALLLLPILFAFITKKKEFSHIVGTASRVPLLMFSLLVLACIYYWLKSPYIYSAARYVAPLWIGLASFYLSVSLPSQNRFDNLFFRSIVVVATGASLFALAEYFGFVDNVDKSLFFPQHISGHVGQKNTLGFFLMAASMLNMILIQESGRRGWYITLLLILSALFFSDSRSSQLFTLPGLLIAAILLFRSRGVTSIPKKVWIPVLLILLVIPVLLWDQSTLNRFSSLFSGQGDLFRKGIYSAEIKMIMAKPLSGHGMASFIHHAPEFWPDYFRQQDSFRATVFSGHNEYLEMMSQFGIPLSLVFFGFWIVALIVGGRRIVRNYAFRETILLILLLQMMVHATVSVASKQMPSPVLVWFVVGIFWRGRFFSVHGESLVVKRHPLPFILLSTLFFVIFFRVVISDGLLKYAASDRVPNQERGWWIQKAIAVFPENHWCMEQLVNIAVQRKEYEQAHEGIAFLNVHAPHLFRLEYRYTARMYNEQKAYREALHELEKTLHYHGLFTPAHHGRAVMASRLGECDKLEESKEYFRKRKQGKPRPTPFNDMVGPLRSLVHGRHLENMYYEYQEKLWADWLTSEQQIKEVENLSCSSSTLQSTTEKDGNSSL